MSRIVGLSKQIYATIINRIDILFVLFMVGLSTRYYFYISKLSSPMWDAATYLENARNWMTGTPLFESYRPPMISWLTAFIWVLTGEGWESVKFLAVLYTLGAGVMLYITLKKHKGGLFAFGVTILTMLNSQVFFYSSQIYSESLALFFLAATLLIVKLGRPNLWFLAGITAGLTFASRYPIILQAVSIIVCESIARKKWTLGLRAAAGTVAMVVLVVVIMNFKTGTFEMALNKDTSLTVLLSPYYIFHSIDIWGVVVVLVPLALLFRKTYVDSYNYAFIGWFIVSLLFWSANSSNHQFRFAIQFTPAVYYLVILAIDNFASMSSGKPYAHSFLASYKQKSTL